MRSRSWRRFQAIKSKRKSQTIGKFYQFSKPEKNWKLLGSRASKLGRAKQLGFEYPRKNSQQLIHEQYYLENAS